MSSPLLLEGQYLKDEMPALREAIRRLEGELRQTRDDLSRAQNEARVQTAAIVSLRRQLSPLYRALQGVFGELEHFGEEAPANLQSGVSKWEAIKARMSPRLQQAIDIFLAQGSMNLKQLAAAMRMNYTSCSTNIAGVLLRQGLLVKNGRDLSLKSLE